jgi:hypothetical protein
VRPRRVWKVTQCTAQVSKAQPSMSSFISVFAPVRMAGLASQVCPISQVSGVLRPWNGWPTGHVHQSGCQNLVEPITAPSAALMTANGIAVPASRWATASWM